MKKKPSLRYNEAIRLVRLFGGDFYSLGKRRVAHVWGLVHPTLSLCNRYHRPSVSDPCSESRIDVDLVPFCSRCMDALLKWAQTDHTPYKDNAKGD